MSGDIGTFFALVFIFEEQTGLEPATDNWNS